MSHIDLAAINREDFDVKERHVPGIGPVVLINPTKTKFRWADDELHLRSLVCLTDGTVISSGFPKFFNAGEVPHHTQTTIDGVKENRTIFTTKLDGTLIIRSIHNGVVYWRTRGSHELGEFEEPVMKLVQERHPLLLDPKVGGACSLLFEYVGPNNQIVVKYEHDHLFGLALTAWQPDQGLKIYRFPSGLARDCELDLAPAYHQFRTTEELQAALATTRFEEGYVTWTALSDGSYHLTKYKTPWYITLHGLRSESSPRFVREYCTRHWLLDVERFRRQLEKDGYDWEFVSFLEPAYKAFEERAVHFLKVKAKIDDALEQDLVFESGDRKAMALACKALSEKLGEAWTFHYAIMQATGKTVEADDIFKAQILECGSNEYRNLKKQWASEKSSSREVKS